MHIIKPWAKALIICPVCNGELDEEYEQIVCSKCASFFKVENDIPLLLSEKSLTLQQKKQIFYFSKQVVLDTDYYLEAWQKSYIFRFLENFSDVYKKIIVDCGTGTGYLAIELAKKGAFVIATDLTLINLFRIKKIADKLGINENLQLIGCLAESMPIKNFCVDYFLINSVLEHVVSEKKVVEEIDRITHTGSGLMITVPLKFRYINPLFLIPNLLHDKIIGHLRRYDEITLKNLFTGWKLKNVYYTGHFQKTLHVLLKSLKWSFLTDEEIEDVDNKKLNQKFWSGNVQAFFVK